MKTPQGDDSETSRAAEQDTMLVASRQKSSSVIFWRSFRVLEEERTNTKWKTNMIDSWLAETVC